jgi:hypothetical protein
MKRIFIALSLLLIVVAAQASRPKRDSVDSLAVRIVPSGYTDMGTRSITLIDPSQHFAIVLTNIGSHPIRLWRNWCSWGYFNLSFKVQDQEGRTFVVKRKQRPWNKNYPDWMIIPPGDHMVIKVAFGSSKWQNSPLPKPGLQRVVKLQAVYESAESKEAKKHGVWCGKVSSPENTYTIFR